MAENNKIENTKIVEDSDLNKVSGGLTAEDYQKGANQVEDVIKGIGTILEKFGDMLQLIKTAIDTNTCPICNQKILPLAEKCELTDFVDHIKAAHKEDMQ
jgi:hypothetical protein